MQALTRPIHLTAFALAFTFSSFCHAAGIDRGTMLSNSCAACHGTDGMSPGEIPSIQGKSAEFISIALIEFRDGKRPATVMDRHAKGYTDEEIELIARHFAGLK